MKIMIMAMMMISVWENDEDYLADWREGWGRLWSECERGGRCDYKLASLAFSGISHIYISQQDFRVMDEREGFIILCCRSGHNQLAAKCLHVLRLLTRDVYMCMRSPDSTSHITFLLHVAGPLWHASLFTASSKDSRLVANPFLVHSHAQCVPKVLSVAPHLKPHPRFQKPRCPSLFFPNICDVWHSNVRIIILFLSQFSPVFSPVICRHCFFQLTTYQAALSTSYLPARLPKCNILPAYKTALVTTYYLPTSCCKCKLLPTYQPALNTTYYLLTRLLYVQHITHLPDSLKYYLYIDCPMYKIFTTYQTWLKYPFTKMFTLKTKDYKFCLMLR